MFIFSLTILSLIKFVINLWRIIHNFFDCFYNFVWTFSTKTPTLYQKWPRYFYIFIFILIIFICIFIYLSIYSLLLIISLLQNILQVFQIILFIIDLGLLWSIFFTQIQRIFFLFFAYFCFSYILILALIFFFSLTIFFLAKKCIAITLITRIGLFLLFIL